MRKVKINESAGQASRMIKMLQEETGFEKFFREALKKFGVSSPAQFKTKEDKKKFFDYVDANWKAEDEN